MQLELLAPEPPHAHTDRLAAWYRSIGYREVALEDLASVNPDLAALLLGSCELVTLLKDLPRPAGARRMAEGSDAGEERGPQLEAEV